MRKESVCTVEDLYKTGTWKTQDKMVRWGEVEGEGAELGDGSRCGFM